MAPAFSAKATKCVNAAPARGASASHLNQRAWRSNAARVSLTSGICVFDPFRNGEGHFKHRGKQPESEETKEAVGQKYRLRERYLRHHREKGHFAARPITPGIHSGIFTGDQKHRIKNKEHDNYFDPK